MAENDQEKTEEATQQRRDDFRDRGQVAQTRELASVFILLGSALALWGLGRFFLQNVSVIVTQSLTTFVVTSARNGDMWPATIFVTKHAAMVLFPFLGILLVLSVASSVLQTGLLNNEEALEFNFERLNPVSGLMRLFGLKSWVEGLKSILKLVLVTVVVYAITRPEVAKIPLLVDMSVEQIFEYVCQLTLKLLFGVGIFMFIIAAADYGFQWWDLEKQMRMTKQEIKEEHKSREGDPLIKARIRRIQREMASKRMMSDVKKADVIITNPTHIAVAIQYDPLKMAAPKLVAKGAGAIAEKIKAEARENNIPVMENKPLARTIYKTLKIGQAIPRELFTAVAQVLSYVYRLKRKVMR